MTDLARSARTTLCASSDDIAVDPLDANARSVRARDMLERLYETQARRLARLFNRRGDPQDANDLVQETFARLAQAAQTRGMMPDCPESYLTRVAINVLHDQNRSPARRIALRAVAIEHVEPAASDVEAGLEARDMLRRVEAAMLRLKPLTRDVFIARRFHGYSRAEIADQTGLSLKAIDKHLARAVEHLYRHFGHRDDT